MCGTFMLWGSPSKVAPPSVEKNPFAGSRVWQPSQVSTMSVPAVLKKMFSPETAAAVRLLSRARTGFGGSCTCRMKSVKACISTAVIVPSLPTRPSKATMKLRNAWSSSHASAGRAGCRGSVPKKPSTAVAPASASRRGSTCP